MTGSEMVTALGTRLEDTAHTLFSTTQKLDALNMAQLTVVNLVHDSYLTELETIAENKSVTAGTTYSGGTSLATCTFATASIDPIRGQINNVHDNAGHFFNLVSASSAKDLENSYLKGTTDSPIAFIFDETIWISPESGISTIDIWYLSKPTDIANTATECQLNPALHEAVVDFAESQLWKSDGKSDRAGVAQANATNIISTLNARKGA